MIKREARTQNQSSRKKKKKKVFLLNYDVIIRNSFALPAKQTLKFEEVRGKVVGKVEGVKGREV